MLHRALTGLRGVIWSEDRLCRVEGQHSRANTAFNTRQFISILTLTGPVQINQRRLRNANAILIPVIKDLVYFLTHSTCVEIRRDCADFR